MSSGDITITIIDRNDVEILLNIPSDCGLNLMEICKAAELPVEGTCGGIALCGSCHIYIQSDHILQIPSIDEEMMLDQLPGTLYNSRLACQITASESIDLLKFRLAPLG